VRRAGVVTGLAFEARRARRAGLEAMAAGGRQGAAAEAAELLVGRGVGALLSFGLAGGLDPELPPGTIVLADLVFSDDGGPLACDAAWVQELAGVLPPFAQRSVFGSPGPVYSATVKQRLFRATGAAAVDLESVAVARVAARHRVPFAAVRVIADPAGMSLPSAALAGFAETTRVAHGRVAAELLRHPWQLPAMLQLALATGRALRMLEQCAAAIARAESRPAAERAR
jgi:adenosylhomocysteine nucleosidase